MSGVGWPVSIVLPEHIPRRSSNIVSRTSLRLSTDSRALIENAHPRLRSKRLRSTRIAGWFG